MEKLKAGEYEASSADVFIITQDAVEDVFSQVKHFANGKYGLLWFHDEQTQNYMAITKDPRIAFLDGGSDALILGMPNDYITYWLVYRNITLTNEAVEYIFQLTNARCFEVWTETVIPLRLQQHPDKLEKLASMKELFFELSPLTYSELRAHIFIESIKSLKRIVFQGRYYVTVEQFETFYHNQTTPNGWNCSISDRSFICEKDDTYDVGRQSPTDEWLA